MQLFRHTPLALVRWDVQRSSQIVVVYHRLEEIGASDAVNPVHMHSPPKEILVRLLHVQRTHFHAGLVIGTGQELTELIRFEI